MIEKRYKCTYCSKKRNESKLYEVYYPLLHKHSWHCIECYKEIEDKFKDLAQNITLIKVLKEEQKKEKNEPFKVIEVI